MIKLQFPSKALLFFFKKATIKNNPALFSKITPLKGPNGDPNDRTLVAQGRVLRFERKSAQNTTFESDLGSGEFSIGLVVGLKCVLASFGVGWGEFCS